MNANDTLDLDGALLPSRPSLAEGRRRHRALEPRRVVLVAFATPPANLLAQLPAEGTLIISETPQPGFEWRPLAAELAPPDLDEAVRLLEELNALLDESGTPYRSAVRYHGYEPWWFLQQTTFD